MCRSDKATGIITTADGWKLRAKTFNMKTADGGERVVKKYVKVEEHELRAMTALEPTIKKRQLTPPNHDLFEVRMQVDEIGSSSLSWILILLSSHLVQIYEPGMHVHF